MGTGVRSGVFFLHFLEIQSIVAHRSVFLQHSQTPFTFMPHLSYDINTIAIIVKAIIVNQHSYSNAGYALSRYTRPEDIVHFSFHGVHETHLGDSKWSFGY